MLRVVATWIAKWRYVWNKEVESGMHVWSARVAEENAKASRDLIVKLKTDADAFEAHIKDVAEMEEKGNAKGQEKVLFSFAKPMDGEGAYGRLFLDSKGNLYGTAVYGGTFGDGLIFEIAPNGTEIVLHNFAGSTDGGIPVGGLVMDAHGTLYGAAEVGGHGVGTVFPQPSVFGCGPTMHHAASARLIE